MILAFSRPCEAWLRHDVEKVVRRCEASLRDEGRMRAEMADFDVGDSVRLLKLDEWFFKGLEPDTVVFLRTCVGKKTKIRSFDDYGHAELEFEVPRSPDDKYQCHTVWIDQSWIEKV